MEPILLLTGGHAATTSGLPTYSLNCNYAELIKLAGAIPLLAVDDGTGDLAKRYAQIADGLVLTGGKDIAPSIYNEEQLFDCIVTDKLRDALELALIEEFVKLKKPIIGFCRGLQIINAYFGGSLYQDIPEQLQEEHGDGICHTVQLETGSILHQIYGGELTVNSYHHQGIKELAPQFKATAYADCENKEYRLVEAFEFEALQIYGVQWHPERMTGSGRNPADAQDSLPLINDFVNRCKKQDI